MLNYFDRTIDPIITAIVDEMNRKFLTKTARAQGQSILFFRDPFKLTRISEFASAADALTRNEILSKNEVRQKMGFKPSTDPKADQLINSNINQAGNGMPMSSDSSTEEPASIRVSELPSYKNYEEGESQNGEV
jgi:hypothetical protein